MQPGTIKQEARELLGLTPAERAQAEAALHHHFSAMDSLMEANRYETNISRFNSEPSAALASKVFGLPPLGDEVKQRSEELQSVLKTVLGDERWPMVEEQLKFPGTDTLRRILNLDAGERGQELAVWIQERNGTLVTGYGWGDHSSSFSSGGLALSLFLPDTKLPDEIDMEHYLSLSQLPTVLTGPAMAWLRQQAEARLGKKGGQ